MIGNKINQIIQFLVSKKIFFVLLMIAFLAISINGMLKINIDENIFSTLPKGASFSKFSKLIDEGELSNQIIFSLDVGTIPPDEIEVIADFFIDSLVSNSKPYLKDVIAHRPDIEKLTYNYFHDNFYQFINDSYYKTIEAKLQRDSLAKSLINSKRALLAPGGFVLKEFIIKDPIYLSSDFFKALNTESNFSQVTIQNGYAFTKDYKELLITAKTSFSLSDNKENIALYHRLNAFKTDWNQNHPTNQLDYFGTFQIGAENGIQVKKDTFLTLTITLIVILLILFFYYRKLVVPIYFILPILFGGLFALGFIGYFSPTISGISIATGAVVFGIIMDFSFHFFTHLQHSKSVSTTIKEIASPLLTGAFTTIMAFGALLFTNSVVLQDFGLFTALSIIGAVVFTLIGLPVFLELFNFNSSKLNAGKEVVFEIPKKYQKSFVGIVIVITGVLFYFSFETKFDDNLDNLSLHSDELKIKEKELIGINPDKDKKIYFFAEADTYEKASIINYTLYQKIQELQANNKIISSLSAGKFIVPDSLVKRKQQQWIDFWRDRKEIFFTDFNQLSDSLEFSPTAFNDFKKWIVDVNHPIANQQLILKSFGINDLVYEKNNRTTFITTIVVNKKFVDSIQHELTTIKGVSAFNKAEVAKELLSVVKDDFNYIIIISSLLVFISLLIIYGRIEMALFTFIPMIISWIWILGIAALFNMPFNFVNIVIATFIFGLGDDFSIFVTDGLLHKYKYNKKTLGSYNTAIILSAVTTMIGTGVLFFAKHPAIKSVAIISVLGIFCILFISIIIQPFLFNLFIQNRIEKKKPPLTLVAFLVSLFEFPWFVFGCLVSYVLLGILIILPFPKKRKRYFLNRFLSIAAKSVIYLAPHVRKRIFDKKNLNLEKPSIIIANHTSFLDILLLLMLSPKIIIMVKGWVYNSILFGPLVRYAGYIYVGDNPAEDLKIIQSRIEEGYSIAIFPEGSRSTTDDIQRMHKGAFFLAQELNLDITPILIHGASYVLPKTEYFVKHGGLNLKVLPRIKAGEENWGETFGKRTKSISNYFKQQYAIFKNEQEDGAYLFTRVFVNYVYKGPVLEWYVRIKWKLEIKNFEYYNSILTNKPAVLDVGCGYGYLSYFLHYKNPTYKINAIDYDEEKINIAKNGFDKTENLIFNFVDINSYSFSTYDAIILNDVLHYFSKEKQEKLLEKCAESLNQNGIILIRDGITDFDEKHKQTQLTEKLSTQFFSFNKKEENFYFFSSNDIYSFANKYNFSVTMEEHSTKTSNVLFILNKK